MSLRQFIASRKLLRSLNVAKKNATLRWKEFAFIFGLKKDVFENPYHIEIQKPVTAILIGAGNRGAIYADYAIKNPGELRIIAVAEPNKVRQKKIKDKHQLNKENCFSSWKEIFEKEKKEWDKIILENLKTTGYGRCVYRMDNDQPDHLTVNMLFENGVTAAFSMEAHISYEGRKTRIMGSKGDIVGDMETFIFTDFKTRRQTSWKMKTDAHAGGDHRLVKDWVQAVSQQNKSLLSSSIEVSIESHLIAFAAEKSRLNRTIEDLLPKQKLPEQENTAVIL